MLVYQGIKSEFINDVDLNKITDKILERYKQVFHRSTGTAEINSWSNSMQRMRGVLSDSEIPDNSGVAIEFNIPHTSNRIDFLLSGLNKEDKNSIIIVELKQWEHANMVEGRDGIVSTYTGGANREVVHPSYQAWSYSTLINSFNEDAYDGNVDLHPCAFLHNYNITDDDPINNEVYKDYIDRAPMFGKNDFEKLREFIKKYISKGDDKKGLFIIENGKIRPSKTLQDSLTSVLKGNKEFVLIDDQKGIYEQALELGKYANNHNKKHVMIVEGGPGTGKSVLAINLLKEFLNNNLNAFYVTKNAAPRSVFLSKLSNDRLSSFKVLFKGSGSFVESKSNDFDVLIVDEAHRLNEKSGLFSNLGENQIKEIINASKFSIFFIDENQRVTLKDIGSINEIEKYAKEYNASVSKVELKSQFRCDGSDGYLAWLDNVLEIRETANFELNEGYDFRVFDNPNDLKEAIFKANEKNNKSRLVSGYCWNWIKEGKNKSDVYDITIPEYNFGMSWNLGSSSTWAIDKDSVNEIGCIHTCQGLEFDYVGVIIGDDLRFENGKLVTDYHKRASTDQSIKGIKAYAKKYGEIEAYKLTDSIIKNTYKTLMTRGMKGCYVYCTNKALGEYLKSCLKDTY